MTFAAIATGFCLATTAAHVVSTVVVAAKCRVRPRQSRPADDANPVTVIRPVCRLDNFVKETLASTFRLDYPNYEIIFCLARADDPVAPIVRQLIEANPSVRARLLIGDDNRSPNPKLNNVLKGWDAAEHEWIILADSNVLMPPDYIQRMTTRWRANTGLVCSMPIGSRPESFAASLECAFLKTFQARWQYFGESLGLGFAQGKSMLFRRHIVDRAGGLLKALGAELAEDAAVTKMVRAAGLRVHLVANPFEQPLGVRRLSEVWSRQKRWAILRRKTFPAAFLPELISGSVLPCLAGCVAAYSYGINPAWSVAGLLVVWFGAEAMLAIIAGWRVSLSMAAAAALRDLLLPGLWACAWLSDGFVWRGNAMNVEEKWVEEPDAA
jgi:ceramide glucosyltransferase